MTDPSPECPICFGEREGRLPLVFDRRALCDRHRGPFRDVAAPRGPIKAKIPRGSFKLEQKTMDLDSPEGV